MYGFSALIRQIPGSAGDPVTDGAIGTQVTGRVGATPGLHNNRASVFGTIARGDYLAVPYSPSDVVYDDPSIDSPVIRTPALPSQAVAILPITAAPADDSGVPWWAWAGAAAGLAYFAFGGNRGGR